MSMDHHKWGAMQERHQRYTPKLTNSAELFLTVLLLMIWNDWPQEFID